MVSLTSSILVFFLTPLGALTLRLDGSLSKEWTVGSQWFKTHDSSQTVSKDGWINWSSLVLVLCHSGFYKMVFDRSASTQFLS